MTDNDLKCIKLEILKEIDELLSGSEKMITHDDDPSGMLTEWVLDTEMFRSKLSRRVTQLQLELDDGG